MAKEPTPDITEPIPFSPEEMKAIGEIELGPSRHEKFLNAHYKKLIVILVIVMAVAVACIVYGTWRTRRQADAAAAVIAAMNAGTLLPSAEDSFNLADLEQVQADYPGTSAAVTAELLRGMQLVSGGQEQQGIAALENFIATTAEDSLRVRAQAYLAGHYMRGGDVQKATELWQTVTRAGQSPFLAFAYLSLGDMAGEAGEVEQARTYYTSLQKECPSSPLAFVVRQRLLLLGVDSPEPVAPAPEPAATPAQDNSVPTWDSLKFPTGLTQ